MVLLLKGVRSMKLLPWVLLATFVSAPALACLNAVELSINDAAKLISDAEKALEEGDALAAIDLLSRDFPQGLDVDGYGFGGTDWEDHIEFSVKSGGKKRALLSRLRRLTAVACLRAYPKRAVDAYGLIETELGKSPKDSYLLARRAEALVAIKNMSKPLLKEFELARKKALKEFSDAGSMKEWDDRRAGIVEAIAGAKTARSSLEKLAAADLLVDAEGYAVLSQLRREAKDDVGADAAQERCKTMAKNPAKQCAVAAVTPVAVSKQAESGAGGAQQAAKR